MSELNKLIEEFFHDQRERTHTTILAKIEKYDHVEMKADIKPLIKEHYDVSGKLDFEDVELETIYDASVACLRAGEKHLIRPPYKEGDVVLAVCADRSIDNVIETGEVSEQVGRRRHSLQDALVISGITVEPDPMPDEHEEDLLICKTEGQTIKTRMVFFDDEDKITIAKGDSGDYDAEVTIHDNNNIDVFTKGDINIHAEGTITILGDGIINITAAGALNLTGSPINCTGCPCADG